MDDMKIKVVPMKVKRQVPPEAKPVSIKDAIRNALDEYADETEAARAFSQRVDFLEQLVLQFRKDLDGLHTGTQFNEVRLNKVIRLADTLARKAGVPN